MDCLDLLAVQGTLKSLLQHHSSKSISSHRMCKYGVHPMSKGVEEVNIPKYVFQLFSMASWAEVRDLERSPCDIVHNGQYPRTQGRQRRAEVGLRGSGSINNKSITALDVNQKIRFCLFPLGNFANCLFLCPQGKEVSINIMLGKSGAHVSSVCK